MAETEPVFQMPPSKDKGKEGAVVLSRDLLRRRGEEEAGNGERGQTGGKWSSPVIQAAKSRTGCLTAAKRRTIYCTLCSITNYGP